LSAGADMHNYDGMRGEENPCTVLAWKMWHAKNKYLVIVPPPVEKGEVSWLS
jgi:hypothetical protein